MASSRGDANPHSRGDRTVPANGGDALKASHHSLRSIRCHSRITERVDQTLANEAFHSG